jgi:lipoprotein-releasing system permease protein
MSWEWLVARRYIWSKRRHPFVGIISTISVLGIAVGVAALIVVLAVMNGFDEDLKTRIIGTRAHLVIEKDGPFDDYPALIDKLRKIRLVKGAAPFIEGQALIQVDEWGTGVVVRGIDPEAEKDVSEFHKNISKGTLSNEPGRAVLGAELAQRAGMRIGSEFRILTQSSDEPFVCKVEGLFSSGMYEYDANLMFLNLKNSQKLFGLGNGVTGISVSLQDAEKAEEAKRDMQKYLGHPFFVRTWMDMNRTLFAALKLEKVVMFLILALIIFVACLNIAGSLTIMVMDKTKDIGILKALGAPPASLMKIFAFDGLFIGVTGALTGLVFGLGICQLLKSYSFIDLPKEIYYVNRLPVQMNLRDTALVVGTAILLSFLSAFYPAVTAGRLDPIKALRYE